MSSPLIVAVLAGLSILCLFLALMRMVPQRDPLEQRLAEYGLSDYVRGSRSEEKETKTGRFPALNRILHGFGLGETLAQALIRADVPLTAAEYTLFMLLLGGMGFFLGSWQLNAMIGVFAGLAFAAGPLAYLKISESRRRTAFINQLPDLLTLLVGSLRAGYGLSQAIELVAREVPAPASKEFARVVRATGLGLSLQRALQGMAERIDSDDLDLVVTAINVQYEMGGNLSSVLETISDTIRERVRVLREVRVLTAQQRLTGTILAMLPIGLAVIMSLIRPGYFDPFFEPGWPQFMPLVAVGQMFVGFVLIQKIVNIKV
jgi:tight adherence protein B